MEVLKIFDSKFHTIIKDNITSVLLSENTPKVVEDVEVTEEWKVPSNSNTLTCSFCRVSFDNVAQQREHYKLDWHRYNLRQSLISKASLTELEFTDKTNKDDLSSISGSDSENEDTVDTYATAEGKVFLQNPEGTVFSIYASLVFSKKEELSPLALSERVKNCCMVNKKWTVLMLGGGHFAGAVFHGDTPILHKTFHCYTVRAGQGGAQSSKDNKNGSSHPKSAGASLRRYNEQALNQHVKSIIEAWKTEMDQSALIIYRASGPYNRSVLFGGGSALLDRNDVRLRTIPFSTRRATFAEVKRVHSVLTHAYVYESANSASEQFETRSRNKSRISTIDRAKSREPIQRPLPIPLSSSSQSDGESETLLLVNDDEISFVDSLQEFDDSLTMEQRKAPRKKKPKKSKNKRLKEQEEARKTDIIGVLSRGDLEKLQKLFENHCKIEEKSFVDEILDTNGNAPLHVAALNEQCDTLMFLLDRGANPCVKNQKQQTPYTCTQSKPVRELLKQYAVLNPDKYNYNKAQIPTNVLKPDELAEKRKAQRLVKKEKEKIKKQENQVKKCEDENKERFLKLSDREKRALAAERRILNQSGVVVSRCFLCASDISGKVPFEYLGNRFCSVDCLKAHRMKHPLVLS